MLQEAGDEERYGESVQQAGDEEEHTEEEQE